MDFPVTTLAQDDTVGLFDQALVLLPVLLQCRLRRFPFREIDECGEYLTRDGDTVDDDMPHGFQKADTVQVRYHVIRDDNILGLKPGECKRLLCRAPGIDRKVR